MATNVDIDIAPSTSNDNLEAALSSFRTKAAQDIGETVKVWKWQDESSMMHINWNHVILQGINASSEPSYATAWNNVNFSVKGNSILDNVWGYVSRHGINDSRNKIDGSLVAMILSA